MRKGNKDNSYNNDEETENHSNNKKISFYQYMPNAKIDYNSYFSNYKKSNLQDTSTESNLETKELTVKKIKKTGIKNSKRKQKTITFTKGEEELVFNKYNDKDVFEDMEEFISNNSELSKTIEDIAVREEDFSSEENLLEKCKKKCLLDIEEAFDFISSGQTDQIFLLNNYQSKFNEDDDIDEINDQILNVPKKPRKKKK